MDYEKVLVLGGTGFLGKNLQKVRPDWIYVGRNYWTEKGIVCEGPNPSWNLTSYDDVYDIINGFNPDAVVNLAADVGGIAYNNVNQLSIYENNILINTNIIKACRELEIDRVLSCLSTCAWPDGASCPMREKDMFGQAQADWMAGGPIWEAKIHPYKGHLGYGWSKRMLHIHTLLAREAGYNYSTFAPSNLYGPYDHIGEINSHFVAALVHKISGLKDELRLFGDGKALRQFLYAPDLANIIPELLEKHNSELPLIIAPDENLSIDEMAKQAMESVNKSAKIDYSGDNVGQFRKDCSNYNLRELLGDIDFTSFKDGFKKTYDWYMENK